MQGKATATIYANVVNVRATPKELILEFGVHFPVSPGATPPDLANFVPEVRVVMQADALLQLAEAFTSAAKQHRASQVQAPIQKAQ